MYCNRCGQSIADDSKFCKFCGASQSSAPAKSSSPPAASPSVQPKRMSNAKAILWVVGGLFALMILAAIGAGSDSSPTNTTPSKLGANSVAAQASDGATQPRSPSAATEPAAPANWNYSTDVDKVRGGTSYFATTTSTNSIHQSFPYDSSTTMAMTLRKSPAYGTDVILTISSGQMMCPSYDGCSGTVRFDDGPAQRIEFNGPADNSSDTVFVVGAKSFIAKLKNAKQVVIEKTLYDAGNPQFEFDVSGLNWDH